MQVSQEENLEVEPVALSAEDKSRGRKKLKRVIIIIIILIFSVHKNLQPQSIEITDNTKDK